MEGVEGEMRRVGAGRGRGHEDPWAVVGATPLRLLAYYIADKGGWDVDQPRNLAKSVTVE